MGLVQEYLTMLVIVLAWIILGLCRPVVPAVPPAVPQVNMTTTAPKSVRQVEKELETIFSSVSKMVMPYFVRNSDLNISGPCMATLVRIFVDVRKLKVPALKLLDAMAKPPYGILRGSFAVMGDYDECLKVSSNRKGDIPATREEETYHGQYCTIEAEFPPKVVKAMQDYNNGLANYTEFGKLGNFIKEFPAVNFAGDYFKFRIGVCVPNTCTANDVRTILGAVPVDFVPLSVSRCEDGREWEFNVHQIIFLSVLALLAICVMIGTILDGWLHVRQNPFGEKEKNKFIGLLLAFSIYGNTKKLLSTKKDSGSEITAINGMYFLGTVLIIIYHTYFLPFFLLFSKNGANFGVYLKDFEFTLLVTMGISIEAYFLFSGLTLVYPRFRRGQKDVKINVIKIIVRRYIRLCPSMLFILGLIVVLPLIGSGPVFQDIFGRAAEKTQQWWWTYLLMFNNFLQVKEQNFLYLWFIPCLMQITIAGALSLWLLAKFPKVGSCVIVAAGVGCNVALGVLTYVNVYPPTYAVYYFHNREHFEMDIYTSPLSHVFSYGLGMLLGYFMAKNPNFKFSKVHVVVGWLVSFFLTVGVQFIAYAGHDGRDPDPTLAAIYAATHRTAFSLGLGWIILACTNGYGGVVGKVFCWKGFAPLSKLGYFGYLMHYIVITFHISSVRWPLEYSHYENWIRICAYILLTFGTAYIMYIAFELPLTYVESLFLSTRPSTPVTEDNKILQNGAKDGILHINGILPTIAPWNEKLPTYVGVIAPDEHSKL